MVDLLFPSHRLILPVLVRTVGLKSLSLRERMLSADTARLMWLSMNDSRRLTLRPWRDDGLLREHDVGLLCRLPLRLWREKGMEGANEPGNTERDSLEDIVLSSKSGC